MKFLADENLPLALLAMLREAGHDVMSVREVAPALGDEEVLGAVEAQRRVLITEDKDFGELVFLWGRKAAGVILLRLSRMTIPEKLRRLSDILPVLVERAPGHFIVVNRDRIRCRRLLG